MSERGQYCKKLKSTKNIENKTVRTRLCRVLSKTFVNPLGIAVPSASSSARAPARREFQRPKFGQKPAGAAGRDTGRWAWQVSPAERPPARDAEQKEKRLKQLHGTQALHAVHGILSRKSEEELLEDDSSLFDED